MNILTFDIEDWFHIEFDDEIKSWNKYESRLENNIERIFEILVRQNQSATFFCLGWIADKHPNVIRKIDDLGYEIGSHSYDHKLIYNKTKQQFEEDLKRSIFSIEDIIGKKVKYFRAPAFSINENTPWFFEIIHKYGIELDASVFPSKRDFGGFSNFSKAQPILIDYKGMEIKELPINTYNFLGRKVVFSGGGYFRLLPYTIIKNMTKSSTYVMTYFHPRDFDSKQPILEGLSYSRRFKSYVGLSTSFSKFNQYLAEFKFIDIREADTLIDWSNVDKIRLN